MHAAEWFTVEVRFKRRTEWVALGKCHDTREDAQQAYEGAKENVTIGDVRLVNTQVYRRVVEPPEQIEQERTDARAITTEE